MICNKMSDSLQGENLSKTGNNLRGSTHQLEDKNLQSTSSSCSC